MIPHRCASAGELASRRRAVERAAKDGLSVDAISTAEGLTAAQVRADIRYLRRARRLPLDPERQSRKEAAHGTA